jgi:hypothetical protein
MLYLTIRSGPDPETARAVLATTDEGAIHAAVKALIWALGLEESETPRILLRQRQRENAPTPPLATKGAR